MDKVITSECFKEGDICVWKQILIAIFLFPKRVNTTKLNLLLEHSPKRVISYYFRAHVTTGMAFSDHQYNWIKYSHPVSKADQVCTRFNIAATPLRPTQIPTFTGGSPCSRDCFARLQLHCGSVCTPSLFQRSSGFAPLP